MTQAPKSEIVLPLRIILVDPPSGVDFGIQEGKGSAYKVISVQRAKGGNLSLECSIRVIGNRENEPPNFTGSVAQGPRTARFVYIDIGKLAGQFDSCWQRRIKIPLSCITWQMIDLVAENPNRLLQATIPGTGKDGGPSCATQQPINGWLVVKL